MIHSFHGIRIQVELDVIGNNLRVHLALLRLANLIYIIQGSQLLSKIRMVAFRIHHQFNRSKLPLRELLTDDIEPFSGSHVLRK
ncbi:hypothetical protein D3C87_668530 [compost metagenome]